MKFRLQPARPAVRENHVEKACLDLLRHRKWWPIRQHVGTYRTWTGKSIVSMGVVGDPDYAVMRAPSFFLETKAPDGKLSDAQVSRIEILKRFYGLETVVVADVKDLENYLSARKL